MSDDKADQQPVDPTGDGDAHIRNLLSELGSGPDGAPVPPAVAARLEDTLARLVAERDGGRVQDDSEREAEQEGGASGSVVPLRRRWPARATAAAAAVVVLGAGGVAAANFGVFAGSGTSNDSGSAHDRAGDSTASGSAPEATSPSPATGGKSLTRQGTAAAEALPRLRGTSFGTDVATLLRHRAALVTPEGRTAGDSPAAQPSPLGSASCVGPRTDDGAVPTPVRYNNQLAALVVHPTRGGHQLVEAWTCDGRTRLATTVITP